MCQHMCHMWPVCFCSPVWVITLFQEKLSCFFAMTRLVYDLGEDKQQGRSEQYPQFTVRLSYKTIINFDIAKQRQQLVIPGSV